jgi:hypothetical protein
LAARSMGESCKDSIGLSDSSAEPSNWGAIMS